eukprot:1180885-Prorocentrum_minimum.AAC.4
MEAQYQLRQRPGRRRVLGYCPGIRSARARARHGHIWRPVECRALQFNPHSHESTPHSHKFYSGATRPVSPCEAAPPLENSQFSPQKFTRGRHALSCAQGMQPSKRAKPENVLDLNDD